METDYQRLGSNLRVADVRGEAEQRETRRERGVKNIPGGKEATTATTQQAGSPRPTHARTHKHTRAARLSVKKKKKSQSGFTLAANSFLTADDSVNFNFLIWGTSCDKISAAE